MKQEKSDLEQLIEQEVDEDLERERRAAEGFDDEDGYGEEEDGQKDDGKEGMGSKASFKTGNRGRGGHAGDRDGKFNTDGRKRRMPKGEFEASDDDEGE